MQTLLKTIVVLLLKSILFYNPNQVLLQFFNQNHCWFIYPGHNGVQASYWNRFKMSNVATIRPKRVYFQLLLSHRITHRGWVTFICVSKQDHHCSRKWRVTCSALSLRQCWLVVNWTLWNKFKWNLNENLTFFLWKWNWKGRLQHGCHFVWASMW